VRQALWREVFAERTEPLVISEVPREPTGWRRLLWWEDILTLVLLGAAMLAVVVAIDQARWVDDMPSLYPLTFSALGVGALLARLRLPEALLHILALPIGAGCALLTILSNLPGSFPEGRYWELHHRMADWFYAAFNSGISNDELPFIVLVVPVLWLSAYLSAWAIFRWQNAWMAVIPGGAALLANMSLLPGSFSLAFVVYVVIAALIVTRIHFLERAKAWRAEQTPYPPMLSLSVLHATFWIALLLLIVAWVMPAAGETDRLETAWEGATDPVEDRLATISRLFVGVNSQQSNRVHDFEDILPFLGSLDLPDTEALQVLAEAGLAQPQYLRAQSYEIYTSEGWRRAEPDVALLRDDELTNVDEDLLARLAVSISIRTSGGAGDSILTVGQPLAADRNARIEFLGDSRAVSRLRSPSVRREGEQYRSTGSVSIATENELRNAGRDYPAWVTDLYLELPDDVPARVGELALRVAQSAPLDTPYDEAAAIERHLREEYPYNLNIPDTPRGRDTVDYFLFDLRRGYFDYHASAMVVMLRTLGIPARLAVGYEIAGDAVDQEGRLSITEAQAFAWPEVYFPSYGWVEFNPTPNHRPITRSGGEEAPEPVVQPPDEIDPLDGFGGFPEGNRDGRSGEPGSAAEPSASNRTAWLIVGLAAGAVTIVVVGGAGGHYLWARGLSTLAGPARLWGQTVRLASWGGLPPAAGETAREYARTISNALGGRPEAAFLAEAYTRQRYGGEQLDSQTDSRLEAAWRSLRGRLLLRLLRRR
jgi:transglutaminase-like putative cysteine protease